MDAASPRRHSNPFPGLRPFRSDEHHLFFGREEQTSALLQLLRTNRFLAVVGTSGSGKSSLVRAGMIAELHGGTMTRAGSTWEVMILRPGGSPVENLARAFVDADLYDPEDPSTLPRLLATLSRSRFGLVEAMKQSEMLEPGTNLLVVVDQFEELFRFRQQGVDSEETAAAFVNLLLTASEQAECPIYVTITMRSDYLGDCSEIPGLAEAVNEGEYLIPRLLRDQKRDAIEKPIGVGGAKIAPMLVQRLLNEVGDDPDQLPVLQHALMRMWDAWSAGGAHDRPIDVGDFEATGGLNAALSNHADEIYDALPDDRHRAACEKIFKTLTEKGDDNRGIRRPTRLAQLQAIADSDRDTVMTVLDAYRGSGVTFLMPGTDVDLAGRTVLDLSHESLMRGWQRLRGWVEEEAQSARIFRRLLDTARLWSDRKAGLFRDPDLQIALSWREEEQPNAEWAEQYGGDFGEAIAFLETSHAAVEAEEQAREAARQRELDQARRLAEAQELRLEQQQRAASKLHQMIAGLAAVALIAGVACVAALVNNQRAKTLAETARQNEDKAKSNEARAKQSEQATAAALATVASQKAAVEGSLAKAKTAERSALAAEENGRKLLYTTDMRLAPFVWSDDRTTAEQLRVLLAKHVPDPKPTNQKAGIEKPDLRGFEWNYYQHLLEHSASVFMGHNVPVVGGAFTPDGQLATLGQDGQVRRWSLDSQHEDDANRRDLPGGQDAQVHVLSPDGQRAALAEGNKIHVFDTSSGKELFQIDSARVENRQPNLVFSQDGDRIAIVDKAVRWVSASDGEVTATLAQTFGRIESLALSADGLTLAVVGHGNLGGIFSIFRLDASRKAIIRLATGINPGGTLLASALTPDGQRLTVGRKLSGDLSVFDTGTGRAIAQHGAAHASPITSMVFSGDGMKLATADAEGIIKVWPDAQKLNSKSSARVTLKGHQGAITSLGFSNDEKRLLSSSADRTARVWNLENAGAEIQSLERAGPSNVARISPDGQLIVAAIGKSVRLWDAATGRLVRELPPIDKGHITSVAFSPTDNRLLALGLGGEDDVAYVALWDIDAGTELARLPIAADTTRSQQTNNRMDPGALAFSPNGKYLVAGYGSKNVLTGDGFANPLDVWEVGSRRLIRRLNGHTNYCVSLDFSSDGTLLASGSRDGKAIFWSTETWKAVQTLKNPEENTLYTGHGMVESVAFSPDRTIVAMASREGNIHLWDVASGQLLESLKGHSSAVQALAFSPDGRTLASGSSDRTVRLWNVETRRELMQLDSGNIELGQVQSLAFSPNGKHLLASGKATAFWSAETTLWNEPDRAAEQLRGLQKSNADFRSRIRMLSENLRLHEALAKLDANDPRVQGALAATQANWHASRKAWAEAVQAFDRLTVADPTEPDAWLRTPGLLRLAMALMQQGRPRDAAALLAGGAERRTRDGLPAVANDVALGFVTSVEDGQVRVTELLQRSPAAKSHLLPGDVVLKINDTDLNGESIPRLGELIAGEAGTKVRLTVRHAGSDQPEAIELSLERFVNDSATGDLLYPLRSAIEERLAKEPRDAGLLELRAELAGQWSDAKAQVADYTAAIEVLSRQNPEAETADLQRLYLRRGNAHVALREWQEALDDYARVVTDATTDEGVLTSQALAQAEARLGIERWTVLKPIEAKSKLGSTLSVLPDDSVLASGPNPSDDRYHILLTVPSDIDLAAVRLEALTHPSLPRNGPGRNPSGTFAQTSWTVTATSPDGTDPVGLKFDKVWTDQEFTYPINSDGHLNIFGGGEGRNCTAIWATSNPVSLAAGTTLAFDVQFKSRDGISENLGHLRLSISGDPTIVQRESKYLAAMKLADPWQKLAAEYQIRGDQRAIDQLVERRPKLAERIGDLFAQDPGRDWQRAVELYSRGIKAETTDAGLLSKRAIAYEALRDRDAAAADWTRVATGSPDEANLLADFARRLADANQPAWAEPWFEKAQTLYEHSLEADPGNDVVAAELSRLLINKQKNASVSRWTILKPTEMKSEGGATLSKLPDESILASGKNPLGDAYTILANTGVSRLNAIRLEALTDDSLPNRGPGRDEQKSPGTFDMVGFTITAERPGKQPRPVEVSRVAADASFLELTASHWNITSGQARSHTAVYLVKQPVACDPDTLLRFHMEFSASTEWPLQNLGRFRLSASGDPAAFDQEERIFSASKPTDPWLKLAAAYAMDGSSDKASRYCSTALQQAKDDEARKPIIEIASRFDEVISALSRSHPDDPQLQLAWARKLAERGRQHLADGQPARAQADLEKSRDLIAQLRGLYQEPQWTVLRPTELKSARGLTLSLQSDGSIFASGSNPTRDTFTLTAPSPGGPITALRLEMIPDARLNNGGSGLSAYGEFFLTDIEVSVEDRKGGNDRKLVIKDGLADAARDGFPLSNVFDQKNETSWSIYPRHTEPHFAVFAFDAPSAAEKGRERLKVRLESGSVNFPRMNLGRFRLAVMNQADPILRVRLGLEFTDRELVDLLVALGKARAEQGHAAQAVASFTEALALAKDRAGKAEIIAEAAALEGVLEKLTEHAAGDGLFQAELSRHFSELGNAPLADAASAKARVLLERAMARDPENSAWAAALADVLLPPIDAARSIVPTSEREAVTWRYLTTKPSDDWMGEAFDDSGWSTGPGGFGKPPTPNTSFRTPWATRDIWLRRTFQWKPNPALRTLLARVLHDDGFELYLNGKQILSRGDFTTSYLFYPVDANALDLLKPGTNTLAVHCFSTVGYQYVDAGLHGVSSNPLISQKRLASMKVADPWAKLAVAYHELGDRPALDTLLERHPAAASGIGDLYAGDQDWDRAIAEYSNAITSETKDPDLFAKRAEAYEKLQLWERAIADWSKVEGLTAGSNKRYGNNPPLVRRALLYERLRRFDEATADYDRAVKRFDPSTDALMWRHEYWSRRGEWNRAADDLRRVWALREPSWFPEWHYSRNRALLNLLAGDTDGYRQAAAELLTRTDGVVDNEPAHWLLSVFVAAPGMVTDANRARLQATLDRVVDAFWKPRLQAALLFRSGKYREACDLFEKNYGGNSFEFLDAMAQLELGNPERAQVLFDNGNAYIQQQRDKDPGSGVPPGVNWTDWSISLLLQREATRKLFSSRLAELDARLKSEPANAAVLLERARFLARNGLNEDALTDLSRMAGPATDSADYLGLRGRALAGLNRADEALADLNKAIEAGSTDALAYAARGRILWNRREIESARRDLQKSLDIKPSEQAARPLADLLLDANTSDWTVLRPAVMKSEAGATLTLKDDGSLLAGGLNPQHDVYTFTFDDLPDTLRILRLEVLPDESLPQNGPGRSFNGNLVLTEINAKLKPADRGPEQVLQLKNAAASHEQLDLGPPAHKYTIAAAIDHDEMSASDGWALLPETGKPQSAVFELEGDVAAGPGSTLTIALVQRFIGHPIGRCRISIARDSAGFDRERKRLAALQLTDPWARLAAAYHLIGNQAAVDHVIEQHPTAATGIGDLYAASGDWERAAAEYDKAFANELADQNVMNRIAASFQSAGRTSQAVPFLAKVSAATPSDTILSMKVAALQAWFGQTKEFAATRRRLLTYATDSNEPGTAERAAKSCSILPNADKAELDAALALGRKAVELGKDSVWLPFFNLSLGMAEYRAGQFEAADATLAAAIGRAIDHPNDARLDQLVDRTASFYRALCLFRRGEPDEARALAIAASAKMKPLPADERNPLATGIDHDDLILWLAYKEAKALISFDQPPAAAAPPEAK